jgi:hypothetical protein
MVLVDTTVWIDYLRGTGNAETQWLDSELGIRPVALTDLILCEVLQGVRDDDDYETIRRHFMQFQVFETGGIRLALASAQNYRELRRRGHTIRKTVDCLIATFCLLHGHALLHRDRDYDPFERYLGMQVVHP